MTAAPRHFPTGLSLAGGAGGGDQASALRRLVDALNVAPPARAETAAASGESIECAAEPKRAPIVTIASGKGGVGKTTIAVNLCVALAATGARVTLLDGDLGLANADLLCGLTPRGDLTDVLEGRRDVEHVIASAPGGFRLVPGAAGVASMADPDPMALARLEGAVRAITASADVLVIDCGAGIGRAALLLFGAGDLRLIVATPEPTSIADAYALLKRAGAPDMNKAGGAKTALVVNQAANEAEANAVAARISAVSKRFLGAAVRMAGWAPLDARAGQSIRARKPMLLAHPKTGASVRIRALSGFVRHELGLIARPAEAPPRPRTVVSAWLTRVRAKPEVTF